MYLTKQVTRFQFFLSFFGVRQSNLFLLAYNLHKAKPNRTPNKYLQSPAPSIPIDAAHIGHPPNHRYARWAVRPTLISCSCLPWNLSDALFSSLVFSLTSHPELSTCIPVAQQEHTGSPSQLRDRTMTMREMLLSDTLSQVHLSSGSSQAQAFLSTYQSLFSSRFVLIIPQPQDGNPDRSLNSMLGFCGWEALQAGAVIILLYSFHFLFHNNPYLYLLNFQVQACLYLPSHL